MNIYFPLGYKSYRLA